MQVNIHATDQIHNFLSYQLCLSRPSYQDNTIRLSKSVYPGESTIWQIDVCQQVVHANLLTSALH